MRLFSSTIVALFLVSCTTMSYTSENILKPMQYAAFVALGDVVYCTNAVQEPCGLRVSGCSNGHVYMCANNVLLFSIADYDKANGVTQ